VSFSVGPGTSKTTGFISSVQHFYRVVQAKTGVWLGEIFQYKFFNEARTHLQEVLLATKQQQWQERACRGADVGIFPLLSERHVLRARRT
jgi:hypothetical protein